MDVAVVGAGIFGVTAALELAERGHDVRLYDPGPLPHPDAASTDLSKLIRADYGDDHFYTELGDAALSGWERWNAHRFSRPLYHDTGVLLACRGDMAPGGFEHDSFTMLSGRNWPLSRVDGDWLTTRGWQGLADGYVNHRAGWAESGAVVAALLEDCRAAGVVLHQERVHTLPAADCVLLAVGAFTPTVLPELAPLLRSVGQPVLHLGVEDPSFSSPAFLPWAADISQTGFYGFTTNAAGVFKLAHHGQGIETDPRGPRRLPSGTEARFRAFLRTHLPALAEAPVVGERLCLYCDSIDGDFLIDRHPTRRGLVVATGGSGHGFKFAPVLGGLIADVVEGAPSPERFAWREPGARRSERARQQ